MSDKCPSHEALVERIDQNAESLRAEFQGAIRHMEDGLKNDIHGVSDKLTKKIDEIDGEQKINREEFIETRTWVKSLFGQFEQVIGEVKDLTKAIQDQEVNQAVRRNDQEHTQSFQERVKALSYEVIKWVVITFVLGGILTLMQ